MATPDRIIGDAGSLPAWKYSRSRFVTSGIEPVIGGAIVAAGG